MVKNIGFVSTRFAGTDGVSLEASKWADIFNTNGLACYWLAGELDLKDDDNRLLVPEAHFKHPHIERINAQIFGQNGRSPKVSETIHEFRCRLKQQLHHFIARFKIDMLVAENVLTIPMNIPLGLALTETIAETQIPTLAHHHDFYWERLRFSVNGVNDYIRMAFPPNLKHIKHVVINTDAQEQLALRTGLSSVAIPNAIDFENPPKTDESRTRAFRESIQLAPGDKIILQPTRIIQRKGIEFAIELVKELKDPRYKLLISHEAGDEGFEYADWLKAYASEHAVDLRIFEARIANPWTGYSGNQTLSLWDVYPHADFITYPSLYEGFGNAFLEAVYFKKPILINRYATFVRDIEPLGFDLAVMDGYLSKQTVQRVRTLLESSEARDRVVAHNYKVATRHFSYAVLRRKLNGLFRSLFGEEAPVLSAGPNSIDNDVSGKSALRKPVCDPSCSPPFAVNAVFEL